MKDRQNTINGWVLFAGVVALGASIVSGEIFKPHRPEKMGYPIAGVPVGGEGDKPEVPIAVHLQTADVAKGEAQFKKCAACHTIDAGGAAGIGPGLFGIMGKPVAGGSFAYSADLKAVGGSWDWDKMSAWIAAPKKLAPGTKMSFPGMGNPQDRADLLAFLNSKGGSLTVPPPPAEDPAATADKAAAEAEDAGAEKAPNEPVLNEPQAAKGERTLRGEAAPGEAPGQ
ncbi:MAG TPA: c-type cytochrome [Sphingomicrobium sp.]|nr:c-type cytochrome [Sphingomicrobium sp.]